MEFDVSKVYTSVNADELKVGSKVICADNLYELKLSVDNDCTITTLKRVLAENCILRFGTANGRDYALAYLIQPPEEKKLKVSDLKLGDILTPKYDEEKTRYFSITGINYEYNKCFFNNDWYTNEDLIAWEKVEK